MHSRRATLRVLLATVLTALLAIFSAGFSIACAAGPMLAAERLQALADLGHPEMAVRREAIVKLGKVGTAADAAVLLAALRDPDLESAKLAETAVGQVWGRSGDRRVDGIVNQGIYAMSHGRFTTSVDLFSEAIKRKPAFAEAWNKRATAYFLMGDYRHALRDCAEVLKRNPRHFGALAGYGQIYLRLDDPRKALRYLERALEINPNLDEVSELIARIEEQLEAQRGQTI